MTHPLSSPISTSRQPDTTVIHGVIHSVDSGSQVVVVQWSNGASSNVPLEHLGPLHVDHVWKGARLCQLKIPHAEHPDPLLILEPEYVVDVTDVAATLAGKVPAPLSVLLQRLHAVENTRAMIAGTLLNTAFDLLAAHPEMNDSDVLQSAFTGRALALATLAYDGQAPEELRTTVADHLPLMRKAIHSWSSSEIVVEPYVISPVIGLQGRFDILISDAASVQLIEMKGGSAPRTGVRPSHLVQAASYALLHIVATGAWPDATELWYVTDSGRPFRSIDRRVLVKAVANIVHARNAIVAMDRGLAQRRFDQLRAVSGTLDGLSSYDRVAADRFAETYRRVDAVARTVFQAWLSFVMAERWEQRMGDHGTRARAALWRQPLTEKMADSACIVGLTVDADASNLEAMRLTLRTDRIPDCSLRMGDLVVLHPPYDTAPAALQILKGTLDEIGEQHVTVTLRNKQASLSQLLSAPWVVESDVADASLTNLLPSLRTFLEADPHRRDVLLGVQAPVCTITSAGADADLSEEQQSIVNRALGASDYFLIHGPPGTGKTSRILRSIVRALLTDPEERVLVMAYTNRAVNEICAVLDAALPPGSYVRHGSAAGVHGTNPHVAIPSLGRQLSPDVLAQRIADCRCVVATVSSLHSGRDIFAFGSFTTAIVDEASQILEPYLIGPLLHARRAILIGDHFQLPPVVGLPPEELELNAPSLQELGFTSLGMTTFERLHRRCTAQGWHQALATLTRQGRMHQDVMAFPSAAFYGGVLQTASAWQEDPSPLPWKDHLPSRSAFFPVKGARQADAEADVISALVQAVDASARASNRDVSIGVITPFRVQNRAISLKLPPELRSRVTVDTVERFQGSQRDVIFFGATVGSSVELRNIRSDVEVDGRVIDRKLNVACTRAREQFVLVGHPEVLQGAPVYAKALSVLTWLYGH